MSTRNDPYPSVKDVVNDPNYVPLAANKNGDVLTTIDGTILLVSSTLLSRGRHIYAKRRWLKIPARRDIYHQEED